MTTTFWAPAGWTGHEIVAGIAIAVREDGHIASVAANAKPAGAIELQGMIMPGLVNAHSHAFHRALRGTAHGPGDFWSWRRQMYDIAERLSPESYEKLAAAVYAEMALAGITAVGEFHYVHHDRGGAGFADPNEMIHALVRAAEEAGIRLTVLDTCYLTADLKGSELDDVQKRFSDGSVEGWQQRHADLLSHYDDREDVLVGGAIHSIRAVPEPALRPVKNSTGNRPLHVHVSEQRRENEDSLAVLGRTPVQVLADAGVLDERCTAVHGVHLTSEDRLTLAASGAAVCVCPTTERDLGDGWAPTHELVELGVPLSLGSDSHAVIDLFEEARAVELNDRARLERRGVHHPAALLAAATAGGANALGWNAGRLAPGMLADFIAIDLDSVRTVGHDPDPTIVFSASSTDVTDVVVSGQPIVSGGRHINLGEVPPLLAAALASVRA